MPTAALLTIPALRAIVEQTLDAKVFYQDEFERSCRPTWDIAIPARELRLPDLIQAAGIALDVQKEQVSQLKEALAAGGRGAWAIVRRAKPNGGEWYLTLICDGFGEVHGRSDGWTDVPTFAAVVDRMVGMEVYRFRHVVETERTRAACAAALASLQLKVGTRLHNVRVAGTTYSSALVQSIHDESGSVTLHLTKRGSAKRYEATVPATRLTGEPSQHRGPNVIVNGAVRAA
ncbi:MULTISPECIES: hypothetical protein [unclassified Rhodanobacter]|uniref:hypothetical protein n=1 Tax=unclassified Rhodanobacter TaxID=2621553 RepID=UPI0007AA19F3|nr:hypothetical protein [Rhodanobacter sp. FW510-R10]KZC32638.1 hypothetical protein RhoFW510R10_12045 [Rhodanobacter sp. FW510-R10]